MSERFLFMPSLGFCVAISYALVRLSQKNRKIALGIFIGLGILFSIKTITRNFVWKNDFTLFTTDVKTSSNSAKVLNAAGGALVTESGKEKNTAKKQEMLSTAIPYLEKALTIHPTYKNAALLLGNARYFFKLYEKAIPAYEKALQIDPNYPDAQKNLAIALRDAGRKAGEQDGDLAKAKSYLNRSIQLLSLIHI